MAQAGSDHYLKEQIEWFWVSLLFLVGFLIVVYFFYEHPWFYIQYGIFTALSYLPDPINQILFFYNDKIPEMIVPMAEDLHYYKDSYEYYAETPKGAEKMASISYISKWIILPYTCLLSIPIIIKELRRGKSAIKKPGQGHAMYAYARSQKEIWPYIKPVASIMEKISKESDLDNKWYAASKIPSMWMKQNGMLRILKNKKTRSLFTQRQREEFTLDKRVAYKALMENLGDRWSGVDNLSQTYRWVLAVIVPHVYGKVKESRLLNRKICNFHETNSPLSKSELKKLEKDINLQVDKMIDDYKECFVTPYFISTEFEAPFDPLLSSFEELDSEKDMFDKGKELVKECLLTHAYNKTVFFALIKRSWVSGVLSASELLWVKMIDRDLYYVLTQQGRTSCFVEASGAWAHYLSEDTYGFKVLAPQIDEAVRSLDYDLFKTHSNYHPHERWDNSAKWDKLVPDFKGKSGINKPSTNSTQNLV